MTDEQNSPTALQRVTKLITLIEGPGQEVHAELQKEHFESFPGEEMNKVVSKLLAKASEQVLQESELLAQPENAHLVTPINLGSLYDEVVFESSVYVTEDNQFMVNTSFGRLANNNVAFSKSLKHASDVIEFISEKFLMNDGLQIVENPNS